MGTYTTIQGDTWDLMAYKLYGHERYMKLLADANKPLVDYMVFPSGTVINVPEIPEGYDDSDTVFWRQDTDENEETYSSVEEGEEDE